jgi:hypothetical protein
MTADVVNLVRRAFESAGRGPYVRCGRDQAAAAQYRGRVSFDAPDRSALVRAVHDAWDRRLRLVHITIADEDGDGYPSFDVDRWVIEVRVPLTDDEAEAVPVARVTAFTVRAPDEVEEIVEALQTSDAGGSYSSVVTGADPSGGPFAGLFAGATEVLERDDLLIIDRLEVEVGFEDLPHLVPAIVAAVQNGPAGRTAAFVLADRRSGASHCPATISRRSTWLSGPTPVSSSASTQIRTRRTSGPPT